MPLKPVKIKIISPLALPLHSLIYPLSTPWQPLYKPPQPMSLTYEQTLRQRYSMQELINQIVEEARK